MINTRRCSSRSGARAAAGMSIITPLNAAAATNKILFEPRMAITSRVPHVGRQPHTP